MSKLLAMMMKPKNYMYATIKGSLTDNNGVFSGFSYNNFLTTQEVFDTSKDFEIVLKANTGTMTDNQAKTIFKNRYGSGTGSTGFVVVIGWETGQVDKKKIKCWIYNENGSTIENGTVRNTILQNNTDYLFRFSQKLVNNSYIIKMELSSDNGNTWNNEGSWISSYPIRNSGQGIAFGGGESNAYWEGSIDLNQSYIKIANTKYQLQAVVGYTEVGTPTISNGVVSDFTTANYIQSSNNISFTNSDNWEICTPKAVLTGTDTNTDLIIMNIGNVAPSSSNIGYFRVYWGKNTNKITIGIYATTWTDNISGDIDSSIIGLNTPFQIKISCITGNYKAYYRINDGNWIEIQLTNNLSNNYSFNAKINFGIYSPNNTTNHCWQGSLNFNYGYIVLNGTKYIFTLP